MEIALHIFVSFFSQGLQEFFIKIIMNYFLIIPQIKNNLDLFLIFISCFMTGAIPLGKVLRLPK
jgi:hypothetical protein